MVSLINIPSPGIIITSLTIIGFVIFIIFTISVYVLFRGYIDILDTEYFLRVNIHLVYLKESIIHILIRLVELLHSRVMFF